LPAGVSAVVQGVCPVAEQIFPAVQGCGWAVPPVQYDPTGQFWGVAVDPPGQYLPGGALVAAVVHGCGGAFAPGQ